MLTRIGINPTTLPRNIRRLKLKCFDDIKLHKTLEKYILEAEIEGKRGRGRPVSMWEQDIEDWVETTTQAGKLTQDRALFR